MLEKIADAAYEALQLSEERLKMVLDGSEQGFWDWNIETGEVQRNERWAAMLGYAIKDFENDTDTWTDLVHPDDRDEAWASIIDHLEGRTDCHKKEYRMRAKDGTYRWVLDHAKIVKRDADGKPLRMSGTHMDITERKLIEEERDRLIVSLQEAMQEIRTLKGIIPICSYCYRIRDEAGAWDMLEAYLAKHSNAEFSHGICPECHVKVMAGIVAQNDGHSEK